MSNQNGVHWQAGDIILDLYKVIGILSQGEWGEVYKVRHLGWQTDLAIQNLTPAAVEQLGGVEKFEHQLNAWSSLGAYPHIVGCYYVRSVAGHPLIFTEYVAGESLRHWLDDRHLYSHGETAALQRILDLAIQWAWGLGYAHEQGVLHQAVIPESVLITPAGEVRLQDFGWGWVNPEAIAYRAPEQSDPATSTVQSEVWSWALSVLEMFAGGRPWSAETLTAQGLERYLDDPLGNPLGQPTAAQLAGVSLPQMPLPVTQLLRRCLQENPDNRPTSLREIATELQMIYWRAIGQTYPRHEPPAPAADNDANRLNNRAVLLWDLGQHTEAIALWEQAIAQQPLHLEALYNRGLIAWRSGKASDEQLLLQLESSRSAHPDWSVDYLLSLVHLERGDYEAALNLLEGINASGIQQEEMTATLAQVKERLPYTKKLLPNFGTTPQPSGSQAITAMALGVSNLYALSGEESGLIRLWEIATSRTLSVFKGHQGRVETIAFSSDGCYLLSGGEDQTLHLWNIADTSYVHTFDGRERRAEYQYARQSGPISTFFNTLDRFSRRLRSNAHQGAVRSVVFSPDNRYILSGGDDNIIKLWEMKTGKCLRTFQGHWGPVVSVLFTPDRDHILSASVDQTIKLWQIASGQVVQTFKGNRHLTSLSCSAEGRYVVAGADPIRIWDITTGQLVQTLEAQGVQAVAFSPEGRFVLSAGEEQLQLWEVSTGRCLRTLTGHQAAIRAIAFSSEGDYVLSADAGALKWWAMFTSSPIDAAPLRLTQTQLADPQVTSDQLYEQEVAQAQVVLAQGDALAAAQHIRQARSQIGYSRKPDALQVWLSLYTSLPRRSLGNSWEQVTLDRYPAALRSVVFSPDSNCILTGSADATLKLWEIQTRRCLLSLEGHKSEVTAVACSPVDRSAISGSADTTLKRWNLNTGECLRTLVGHSDRVQSVAMSPTGRYVLSGSADTTLKLWEVATGRCLRTLTGHPGEVMVVAFSPEGRYVLSGSADTTLKRWDIATGDCLNTFASHTDTIHAVAVSPDGRYVLSGSADQTLKLWNLMTGDCLRTFSGHTAAVRSVSLSADGRYALSGSDDKTCKLWNVLTGDCVWTWTGHTAAVRSVSLSADGRYALSGSDDKTCKLSLLDWELADTLPTAWDEAANPYLEVFLQLHTPTAGVLPLNREPTPEEITVALTPQGTPTWTENQFSYLMQTLKVAGYGWLKPDQVRQQLSRLTQAIAPPAPPSPPAQVLSQPDATAFATVFGTEFATAFKDPDTSARVVLTATAGSLQGQEFAFGNRTICIIGRAKDCHLQLPNDEQHKTISRYHCLLDINPPIARIRDLGSLHGTYINGQMIGRRQRNQTPEQAAYNKFSEHDLASGDEIKL
ncbi:MAG TPA: protein kinase, partial [Coleofasciculaceae cyanobacterium]